MMRNWLFIGSFEFLYGVVEKEVDEDGVDILRVGMLPDDFLSELLYAPDAAASEFDLPGSFLVEW